METDPGIDFFGVPFFAAPYPTGSNPAAGRNSAPLGWLEANVVQFTDPDDLVILSRSGDERAKSAHDGNLITFHRVRDFRGLAH